ncbi:MAG: 16S rRNA (uracil(1498)-N(3))-methyltransferase [Alphaproteobacteria bacterium]
MSLITLKRLFINESFSNSENIILNKDQTHYLINVMRLKPNNEIKIFNGMDGEWLAKISSVRKSETVIILEEQLREQEDLPEVELMFAPLKKDETDFVIQKATELGVTKISPIITKRTNAARVNIDRLTANAIEASEQCERLSVPEIVRERNLDTAVNRISKDATLFFLDERGEGLPIKDAFNKTANSPVFLIGPEGGFDEVERTFLLNQKAVIPITLGSRILRAETACMAALACWQAISGDWQ